ncbi:MAG: hypothetical protein ABIZ34_08165 [Candidatus Limnocylindrales bacterium]
MTVPFDPTQLRLAAPSKARFLEPTLTLLQIAGLRLETSSRALIAIVAEAEGLTAHHRAVELRFEETR